MRSSPARSLRSPGLPAIVASCSDPLPLYQPRDPQASDLWQLLDQHFESFRQAYDERYQAKYGFWRPVIDHSVAAFLKCGDLQQGYARVRCPDCYHEMFVAFSCKQRCTCPSCHQKRALLTALHVAKYSHLVRYYGWYSNKSRGVRKKRVVESPEAVERERQATGRSSATWAMLIKRVYELNPLACPQCGGEMVVVAFIEPPQREVIERILKHCGSWQASSARPPPPVGDPAHEDREVVTCGSHELNYVDQDTFEATF